MTDKSLLKQLNLHHWPLKSRYRCTVIDKKEATLSTYGRQKKISVNVYEQKLSPPNWQGSHCSIR